jgi:hypothetical protein
MQQKRLLKSKLFFWCVIQELCTKKAPASDDRGVYGSGRIGSAVRTGYQSRKVREAMRCDALPCRDNTGPKPFRHAAPIWLDLPGGRVTSHYEGFPGQSKVWSKKPPLADGLQVGSESACRKRGQFRNDRHALAFERRAPGKVAGQRCGERLGAVEGRADKSRVPRLLAPPVPCRA